MTEPDRPVIRWHGGKWLLAPWIIRHLPQHEVYVEPFGGGGSVLMRKPRAYAEVYNDLDEEIVGLFRVLQDVWLSDRLRELLRITPFARSEFELAYRPAKDPVERARRLLIRSFMGFGSDGHNAEIKTGKIPNHAYKHEMTVADHAGLLAALRELQGAVLLSGYHSDIYDDALKGWFRVERDALADGARPRVESRRKTPLLPTPTAQQGGGSSRSGNRIGETPTLDGMARKGLLTNTAVDIPSATILTDVTTPTTAGSPEIPNTRQKFMTPTVADSRGHGYTYDKGDKTKPRASLTGQARELLPTPTASTGKQGVNEPDGKRGQTLVGAARGQKWRTPNTSDADGGTRKGEGQTQLCHQVREQWPTPTVEDGESKGMSKKRMVERWPDNLASAVKMWPTPNASDGERGPDYAKANREGSGADDLTTAVARSTFASPAARDFRSGRGRSENGHTPQLPEQVGGQLNPTWVEWLMGFPLKWTVVKD